MPSRDVSLFKNIISEKIVAKALVLPTPPRIALEVQDALRSDPDIDANKIANLILRDAAIAAGIMRSANSVGIGGVNKAKTLQQAVSRIGLNRIRSLVFTIAMEQMFITNDKFASQRLQQVWKQSVEIAAQSIALVSAFPDKDFVRHIDIDVMTLVAISHQIGLLPIYVEFASGKFDTTDKKFIQTCETTVQQSLTKVILNNWGMDFEVITGASGWLNTRNIKGPLRYDDAVKLISIKNDYFPSKIDAKRIWTGLTESALVGNPNVFSDVKFIAKHAEISSMLS